MPVHKCTSKGKSGYQYGSQKCYIGKDAKQKATKQGKAIHASQNRK